MSSSEIRKCVWGFWYQEQLFKDHLGIEVDGLIDLYPICKYFFPELFFEYQAEDSGHEIRVRLSYLPQHHTMQLFVVLYV
jgi:hypothetical protein